MVSPAAPSRSKHASTLFQLFQTARKVGLLDPPPGVERQTIFGRWALVSGRSEVVRIFITAGASDTLYDASGTGMIAPVDQIINQVTTNALQTVAWDSAAETLTLTAQTGGGANDLPTWLSGHAGLEASLLDVAAIHEESVTITAPDDDSLAIEFPGSSVFPLAVDDELLIVLAANGTVETTGDALYVIP